MKKTARFGARYGVGVKKRVEDVEKTLRKTAECPKCSKKGAKRQAKGIWVCRKCGAKFAGGAFAPKTQVAKELKA